MWTNCACKQVRIRTALEDDTACAEDTEWHESVLRQEALNAHEVLAFSIFVEPPEESPLIQASGARCCGRGG